MSLGAAFMVGLGVEYGATCVLAYLVVRNFLPYVAHCQLAEESSIGVTHDTCDPMDSSDFVSENKKSCHQLFRTPPGHNYPPLKSTS